MNQDRKLKVGQIGVGHFGGYRRMRMRETGLFELVAAYDRNPKALAQCVRQDGARATDSYEELLAEPGLEAVVISTGAAFHAEQILLAAERGLHVFVEKPLCSTPQELEALLEARRRAGVVIGVGHNDLLHHPVARTTKELLAREELGKISHFEKTTGHSGGLRIQPGDWRGLPDKNPGGMLFQCGVHGFHELLFYFGPLKRISARMRYDVHTTATADVALCHLEFASGVVGALNAFHTSPYRHYFNIYGTRCNLYREERCYGEEPRLNLQRTHLDNQSEPWTPVEIQGAEDLNGNLKNFYRAIREGTQPYPSLLDGARAVAAVFAAEESARLGRVVDVPVLAD